MYIKCGHLEVRKGDGKSHVRQSLGRKDVRLIGGNNWPRIISKKSRF